MSDLASYADFYRRGGTQVAHQSDFIIGSNATKITVVTGQTPGRIDVPGVVAPTLQIALRTGGPSRFDLGSGRFSGFAKRGNWIVTPASQYCRYEPDAALDLLIIDLAPETVGLDALMFSPLHQRLSDDYAVAELAKAIWLEAATPTGLDRLWTDAALLTLHGLLARAGETKAVAVGKGGLAPWQVRRATEALNSLLADNVSLSAIASEVGLSPFHFSRAFKHSLGEPPHRYRTRLRLDKACKLLETTDAAITEIAFTVGYESSQALARVFARELGVTPTAWRRQRRQ